MIDRLPSLDSVDLIMPVPLRIQRLYERELNQPLLLADRIGGHLDTPVSYTNPIRIAASPTQTTLSRKGRLKNLRDAFTLHHPASITGKHILLIDNVFITGTTVNEYVKTVLKVGSGNVFVLILGQTVDASAVLDRIHAQQTHHILGLLGG